MIEARDRYGTFRYFWESAVKRRGVELGPDENLTFDTSVTAGDGFFVDAWWLKGYGRNAPHRHARRMIQERELRSKDRLFDVLYAVADELVLELFPVLPRNGRWRLFNRKPRCKA